MALFFFRSRRANRPWRTRNKGRTAIASRLRGRNGRRRTGSRPNAAAAPKGPPSARFGPAATGRTDRFRRPGRSARRSRRSRAPRARTPGTGARARLRGAESREPNAWTTRTWARRSIAGWTGTSRRRRCRRYGGPPSGTTTSFETFWRNGRFLNEETNKRFSVLSVSPKRYEYLTAQMSVNWGRAA